MELLIQQLVNGLAVGSIYALIALGYTMVYGTIKLINFAHGDVYMMGAFIGYFAVMVLKLNVFLALLVAMVACAILGVVIERVAYKPLRKSTRVAALITAIWGFILIRKCNELFLWSGVSSVSFRFWNRDIHFIRRRFSEWKAKS